MITFIIPSIGRPTLLRTLESLKQMNNPRWKAIVVMDGVNAPFIKYDKRITIIQIPKVGRLNHGGIVRNRGIEIADTEWIGFVDDDDVLTPDYIDRLNEELKESPELDVVIFRMKSEDDILPPPDETQFVKCSVGISFCLRTSLFSKEQYRFKPSATEDFDLLDKLRSNNKKIKISDHITYHVKPTD